MRMSEACRETTWRQLSWTADWHVREECYAQALAGLIDAQHRQPLAAHWGTGTTSSSDAQFFRAGARGEVGGLVNLHYGQDPGVKFYTHLSDQFGPFHTKVIAATANEAPYVLDGLLYHQSSLVINEHYTDTGGFSDHVFAMCRLLGFRFAPPIRDLKEKRLYVLPGMTVPPELASLAGGAINLRVISEVRTAAPRPVDQNGNSHRLCDPAQASGLSPPEQLGARPARTGKVGTEFLYAPMAAGPRAASS
jgi:TnpA family transposase